MVELQGTLSYKPTTQMAIVDSFTETRVCNPALRITIRSAVAHFYSDENSGSSGINFATMYSELLIGGFERSVYMTVKACKTWLMSQPEFSGEMAGVIETPRSPPQSLPREKTLLRIFYQIGGHHSGEDFAVRGKEPKDQFQIYTSKDATLRELTTLIKELGLASTRRDARLSFAFVCPDKNGRFVVREVGRTLPYPYGRRRDYEKTLTELGFEIGNYLDVAIL